MAEPITVKITNLNSPIRTIKVSNKMGESAVTSVAGRVGDIALTQSDVAGLENVNNTSDLNSAWVGFKKIWDGPYTDTSTTIPSEFYDYIVYSCLADFYRSDGQTDKAIDADRMMKNILDQEMARPESQRNLNVVLKGMSNHISKQSRY